MPSSATSVLDSPGNESSPPVMVDHLINDGYSSPRSDFTSIFKVCASVITVSVDPSSNVRVKLSQTGSGSTNSTVAVQIPSSPTTVAVIVPGCLGVIIASLLSG